MQEAGTDNNMLHEENKNLKSSNSPEKGKAPELGKRIAGQLMKGIFEADRIISEQFRSKDAEEGAKIFKVDAIDESGKPVEKPYVDFIRELADTGDEKLSEAEGERKFVEKFLFFSEFLHDKDVKLPSGENLADLVYKAVGNGDVNKGKKLYEFFEKSIKDNLRSGKGLDIKSLSEAWSKDPDMADIISEIIALLNAIPAPTSKKEGDGKEGTTPGGEPPKKDETGGDEEKKKKLDKLRDLLNRFKKNKWAVRAGIGGMVLLIFYMGALGLTAGILEDQAERFRKQLGA